MFCPRLAREIEDAVKIISQLGAQSRRALRRGAAAMGARL